MMKDRMTYLALCDSFLQNSLLIYIFPFPICKIPSPNISLMMFPLENSILHSILQAEQRSFGLVYSTLLNNTMSTSETNEQGDDRSSSTESEIRRRPRRGGKSGQHKKIEPTSLTELQACPFAVSCF